MLRAVFCVAFLVFVAPLGCGPVVYSVAVAGAAQAVEEARQAGATQHATYEYHYALEHLTKAREFANEAEYQNASDMAHVAEEYGNRARDLARRRHRESGR